jgi:hypothetical protein
MYIHVSGIPISIIHTVCIDGLLELFELKRNTFSASAAASELGITTANPNAPTVLRVMENTADVHHVVTTQKIILYIHLLVRSG